MSEHLTDEEARAKREAEARAANKARNDERLERLNAIANQADEKKSADGMEDLEDEAWTEHSDRKTRKDEEADEQVVVADAEQADRDLDEARQAGADDVKVTNGETYYRLIVNGQERWLTLQQLRENASKVSAADEYLRSAKELVKNNLSAHPSHRDDAVNPDRGRVRELLNRAIMGEQEAIDELAQAIERPSATADVARLVDERVDGRLTFREAVNWFDKEYQNELSDPRLKEYMVWKDSQLAQSNPDMDFKDRLRTVGEEARALRGRPAAPPADPQRRADKEQRKASVRAIPVAGGRQADEADEDENETYESSIAKMAASRGQARPTVHRR